MYALYRGINVPQQNLEARTLASVQSGRLGRCLTWTGAPCGHSLCLSIDAPRSDLQGVYYRRTAGTSSPGDDGRYATLAIPPCAESVSERVDKTQVCGSTICTTLALADLRDNREPGPTFIVVETLWFNVSPGH